MNVHITLKAKLSSNDISMREAADGFFGNIMAKEKPVYQDLLYYLLQAYGNVEGAEIDELSARQIQYDESPYDIIPTVGYPKLL